MSNINTHFCLTGKKTYIKDIINAQDIKNILSNYTFFEKNKVIKLLFSDKLLTISIKIKVLNKISLNQLIYDFFREYDNFKVKFYELTLNINNNELINFTKKYDNTILF